MKAFASDNYAPAHPAVLAAIGAASSGHAPAYGADPVTQAAIAKTRAVLGAPEAEVALVFNGTGANVLGLGALLQPWEAVLCAASAHIQVDEGGAPERQLGIKLVDVPTPDGKLTPDHVAAAVGRVGDEHAVQLRVVSVTQSTELGTLYSLAELRALAGAAHANGLLLHLDGARIANAAAALGVGLGEATRGCGVDVLSLGLTKNGGLGAEAVVIFDPAHARGFAWRRKQAMQLASKMRFLAAQLDALLTDDLWRENASHANAMARRLAAAVDGIPGVQVTQAVTVNAVFAILPPAVTTALQAQFPFYVWDERTGEVRWMCSWDTTEADVDAFAAAIASAVG